MHKPSLIVFTQTQLCIVILRVLLLTLKIAIQLCKNNPEGRINLKSYLPQKCLKHFIVRLTRIML